MSKPSKLDTIIQKHRFEVEKLPPAVAFDNAKADILALIEEVIGEDEPVEVETGRQYDLSEVMQIVEPVLTRNKLRAEMRLRKDAL